MGGDWGVTSAKVLPLRGDGTSSRRHGTTRFPTSEKDTNSENDTFLKNFDFLVNTSKNAVVGWEPYTSGALLRKHRFREDVCVVGWEPAAVLCGRGLGSHECKGSTASRRWDIVPAPWNDTSPNKCSKRKGGYSERTGGYSERKGSYSERKAGYSERRGSYSEREGGCVMQLVPCCYRGVAIRQMCL